MEVLPISEGYEENVDQSNDIGAPSVKAKKRDRKGEEGFTLLELLIVVVILGLLAAIVGPHLFGVLGKAKSQVARTQMEIVSEALDRYRLDVGRYPTMEEGLEALVVPVESAPSWGGPYLKKTIPNDPWGRKYIYRYPSKKNGFELISLGADGEQGGDGEDKDISVWD